MAFFDWKKSENMPSHRLPTRRTSRPDEEEQPPGRGGAAHPGRGLMNLMRELEDARAAAALLEKGLQAYLASHEELHLLWEDFQKRGGSTSRDLALWLNDDAWRRKDMVLRKGNLRLISSRPPAVKRKPKRVRLRDDDDPPEAA